MRIALQSSRGPSCPSELKLDRHLAGELDRSAGRAVAAHVAACGACRARVADRRDEEALPALPLGRPRRWHRLAWPAAGVLAAAAAVLLLVQRRGGPVLAPGTRTKGGDVAALYVERAGVMRLAGPDEVVHPGDTIQLTTTLDARRWVAAISVDGAGVVSVYHGDDPRAGWQESGADVPLPASVTLDATLGQETIHVLSCRGPIALEPIVARLHRDPAAPPDHEGCELHIIHLHKRAAP